MISGMGRTTRVSNKFGSRPRGEPDSTFTTLPLSLYMPLLPVLYPLHPSLRTCKVDHTRFAGRISPGPGTGGKGSEDSRLDGIVRSGWDVRGSVSIYDMGSTRREGVE